MTTDLITTPAAGPSPRPRPEDPGRSTAGPSAVGRRRSGIRTGPVDPRLLRHARTSRTGIALLAVIGAGQAAATLIIATALAWALAGSGLLSGGAAPGSGPWAAVLLLVAAFAMRAALAWAEQVVAQRTAARVTDELRRSLLDRIVGRGPAWVAAFGAGRLSTVLGSGLDALRPWFSGYLPALVLGVLLPPLVVVIMALVDPTSAVIALLTLPLIPLLGALIGWATKARAEQRWAADARLAGHFLDVVRGLPTLKMYGRAERQIDVIADLTDRHRTATLRVLRVAFLSSAALDLVGTLAVGLIAVQAGLRVAAGTMDLGPALLVILLAPEAFRPLREMAARYHASTDAGAVIADVDEILTGPAIPDTGSPEHADETGPAIPDTGSRERTDETGPATGAGSLDAAHGVRRVFGAAAGRWGVRVAGLRARYPEAPGDAVRLDELTVLAGELVALRGVSGAGKTTALRVLAGLHPAGSGAVAVGSAFYLPQRSALPHARTVAEAFPAHAGTEDVRAALRLVGLDGEVSPETPLGEQVAGVSAGQRQRLALAVLLYRANRALTERRDRPTAPVVTLLLDEPTAHLDLIAEQLVVDRLREYAALGCAVLVVAHRPALLAAADRIVELAPPEDRPPGEPITASSRTHGEQPAREGVATPGPGSGAVSRSRVRRPATAVLLGTGSSLAGIVLTGAAAWLLVRASSLPPVLSLSTAVVLVRGSAVARPLLRYLERLGSHDVAFARLGGRRATVYADLIPHVPGPRLHRRGDLLTRLVDDVDARVDGLLRGRLPAATAALTAVICLAAVAWTAPWVAVPLAAGLLVSGLLAPAMAARQADRQEAATGAARAALRDAVVETVDGVEELGGGAGRPDVPRERSRTLAKLEARAARTAGLASAVAHLGWGVTVAATAIVLAHGGPSAEWIAVLLLATVVLGETVVGLSDAALARRRAAGAEQRVADLTGSPARATASEPLPGPEVPAGQVFVDRLVAGWDPGRGPVLDGLGLRLPAGSRTAVMGRSGCGKSTLAAVLAGLLGARAGTVHVGGTALLVGEETGHVFASTVRENLRLAAPAVTDPQLVAVLSRVGLGGWLSGLPDGLDTWLGTGGSTISGGQRRRLATARALLAEPDLLILDEPTEGIDEAGAGDLMRDLLGAASGRTVLVLAHRTEGFDLVDRVLTLSDGVLTERGHFSQTGSNVRLD